DSDREIRLRHMSRPPANFSIITLAQNAPPAHHRRQVFLADPAILVDVPHREAIARGLLELLSGDAAVVVLIEPRDHPVHPARHTGLDRGLDLAGFERAVRIEVHLLEARSHPIPTPAAVMPAMVMVTVAMAAVTVGAPGPITAVVVLAVPGTRALPLATVLFPADLLLADQAVTIAVAPVKHRLGPVLGVEVHLGLDLLCVDHAVAVGVDTGKYGAASSQGFLDRNDAVAVGIEGLQSPAPAEAKSMPAHVREHGARARPMTKASALLADASHGGSSARGDQHARDQDHRLLFHTLISKRSGSRPRQSRNEISTANPSRPVQETI